MSTDRRIMFSPPDITDEEIDEVTAVLKSGWITTGPRVKEFEKRLAEYIGVSSMVCLSSATACMEMTYRILGIGNGDEVITTAYTYTATSGAICHVGARPVMVDILGDKADDEHSPYEPDYDAIEGAITERTKAIAIVDIAGVVCDYDRVLDIVKRHSDIYKASDNKYQRAFNRVIVIGDAAHSYGGKRGGYISGQAADITSFSFHAVKNITTAEGGAVTWRAIDGISDDELYHDYMLYSLHGQSKDALEKTEAKSWEYDVVFPGYKCNMTDIQAAIGIAQLRRLDGLLKRRFEIASRYDEGIDNINKKLSENGIDNIHLSYLKHFTDTYTSTAHLYLMRVEGISDESRSELIDSLSDKGVPTNVHYKPLPLLTAYKNMGYDIKDYPNSYKYYKDEITLPLHTLLTDDDIDYILDSLYDVMMDTLIKE